MGSIIKSFKRYLSLFKELATRPYRGWRKWRLFYRCLGLAIILIVLVVSALFYRWHLSYSLSDKEKLLIARSSVEVKKIKQDKAGVIYNEQEARDKNMTEVTITSAEDAHGKAPYGSTLPWHMSDGIKFSDAKGELGFKLVPKDSYSAGKYKDGQMVYPHGVNEKHIYTFKKNGVKADIVITKAPKENVITRSWKLELSDELQAKMIPDGSVGIYSASPYLYGNLQISDAKSQQLVDRAKKDGKKDYLVFVLPKPYFIQQGADGKNKTTYDDVSYSLKDNILTLKALNLNNKTYPLSIDPTFTVTTTAEFRVGGDDGMIDYSTPGQIGRSNTSLGSTASFTTNSNYFLYARSSYASIAYNGYLYIIGGNEAASDTNCKNSGTNAYCNDIQYAPINSNGSVGTFTTNTNYFSYARGGHTSVAYNGYLYIIGGFQVAGSTFCKDTGTSNYCNDVQYATINSDGSIGTFTTSSNYFSYPRAWHASVAYNGYLYILGGTHATSDTNCKNSGTNVNCNDVQYAAINSDGSIGTFTTNANYFATARVYLSSLAYNGYLYVMGGQTGSGCTSGYCNDVQYAVINSDGSIGTFTTNSFSFSYGRYGLTSAAYDGHLYIIGGVTSANTTPCKITGSTALCSDVQYAAINSDGSVGAFTTSNNYFTTPRELHASVVYNGYLYVVGGYVLNSSSSCKDSGTNTMCNDIQYAAINTNTPGSTFTVNSNYFSNPRYLFASVAYNGFLYIIGGEQANSDTNCKNAGSSQLCNDVQYAAINNDGSIGTFTTSNNYFSYPRKLSASVAYNGYLYVIGGQEATSDTNCKLTGTSVFCTDIQYATINSDGSIGTFTTNSNYFSIARSGLSSVAYNGYLYVIGGFHSSSDTTCKDAGTSQYCNDVQYAAIVSNGSLGTFTTNTNYFSTPRDMHTSVAYNGYMYVIGGLEANSDTSCKNTGTNSRCNDIQYAAINSNGSLGTFTTNTNYFNYPRNGHTSIAYNGYLYVIGGFQANNDGNCKNSGTSNYCSDTQFAAINSDGSIGTFTTSSNYFTTPRYGHLSAAYNGYLYVFGGWESASDTNCKNAGTNTYCNDIQYATIPTSRPANSFSTNSNYFSIPRQYHSAVAYNGYLYIIGGAEATSDTNCKNSGTSSSCNDIQYAAINSDGSIGTFTTNTNYFLYPRWGHTAAAYNGYLYVIGGQHSASDSNCKNSGSNGYCNDIQYAAINSDGSIGTFTTNTNYFAIPRSYHSSLIYNGYLYVIGGQEYTSDTNCKNAGNNQSCNDIQYAAINSDGSIGTFTTNTNYFLYPRYGQTAVSYNGYLYVIGGQEASSDTNCKNSGTSLECNDIQYAAINSNGSIGTFTTNTNYFAIPRHYHASMAYNGSLYIVGGNENASNTSCKSSGTNQYCTDIQYATIYSDGSIGKFTTNNNYFSFARYSHASVAYMGRLYVVGGYEASFDANCKNSGTSNLCNDTQYSSILGQENNGRYERVVDIGASGTLRYVKYNGVAKCGATLTYATAGTGGVFGSNTTIAQVFPGVRYALNLTSKRYIRLVFNMNDSICGGNSYITDINVLVGGAPEAPTLLTPASGATNQPVAPTFTFNTEDFDGDYIRYRLYLYQSDCTTAVGSSPFTQPDGSPQTGWSGQDSQTSTAYGQFSTASYTYQGTLSGGTTYCWKVEARDPGGSNTYGPASATQLFTTSNLPATPTLVNPAASSTTISVNPKFMLRTTDSDGDYLKYYLQLYDATACGGTLAATIDQTSSQTNWSGQDQQSGTAYNGSAVIGNSTMAIYSYTGTPLIPGHTYSWRAKAIDPGGSNAFGSLSSCQDFTTGASEAQIQGGVTIQGGTIIQ